MAVKTCHKLVASVARAAAGEYYESLMGASDLIWKEWKRQNPDLSPSALEKKFIAKQWPNCIEFARSTLAHMLSLSSTSDAMKAEIYEALLLDKSLLVGLPRNAALDIVNRELLGKQGGRLH